LPRAHFDKQLQAGPGQIGMGCVKRDESGGGWSGHCSVSVGCTCLFYLCGAVDSGGAAVLARVQ